MSEKLVPSFGRRAVQSPGQPDAPPPPSAENRPAPPDAALPASREPTAQRTASGPARPMPRPADPRDWVRSNIAEVRLLCLNAIDPASVAAMPQDRLHAEIEKTVAQIATENRIQLNGREQRQLATDLVNDMLGLGPLQVLLDDDSITDIMVNGPDRVFVEVGGKTIWSNIRFRDAAHLAGICQRIVSAVGRRVDEASPIADARLADGSRVNVVFPPLALDGPYLSIRKFSRRAISFDRLIEYGSLTRPLATILEVAGKCRLNIVISGGTGSGKTTLMNAISRSIDPGERVVTIEDAAELQLQQPHIVRLETRPPSLEGKGEVNQRDLVRNALRMRPDRVIIGEVRGAEAFDMLQAMNTGHDGSMSTIHANTTRDALTRIENMVQMGSFGLPTKAIRTQIAGAIDLIVQVERQRDGRRRVVQVSDIGGIEGDIIITNNVFQYEVQGESAGGHIEGRYNVSRVRPSFHDRLRYFGAAQQWADAVAEGE